MATMSKVVSVRLDDALADRLHVQGQIRQLPDSTVAARLIDEALRMREHPGVLFRDGPTGRRAVIIGGPDVWEVVRGIKAALGGGVSDREAIRTQASEVLDLPAYQVDVAWEYYLQWPGEIDDRIALDRRFEDEALAQLDDRPATAS